MGSMMNKNRVSRDEKKLNQFYKPNISEEKFRVIENAARKSKYRYIIQFFYMLGVGKIFDNINTRTTTRRLKAKQKEDLELGEKLKKKAKQPSNKISEISSD